MPPLDTEKIKKQVLEMKKQVERKDPIMKQRYVELYNYLYTHAPTLFEMVYENQVRYLRILDDMIESANKIKENKLSQYDGDVEIGKKLADIYVNPVVNEKN